MSEEIFSTLTEAQAKKEASKARKNIKDSAQHCPLGVDVVTFLDLLKQGKFDKAADHMYKDNPFPCITGRLCSAPCQSKGSHTINIKALERFVGDNFLPKNRSKNKNKAHVAVIGTGVSGLAAANTLIDNHIQVTFIEAQPESGGFLRESIPNFRLPRAVLEAEVERVIPHSTTQYNTMAGTSITLDELAKKYDAVLLCTGASKPVFALDGDHLNNVFTPQEYYAQENTEHQRALIIGGSNTALETALTATHRGSEAMIIHHDQLNENKLDKELFSTALSSGVKFLLLTKPVQLVGHEGKVNGVECQQMRLADDYEGGQTAVPLDDSVFSTDCDHVILAQGFEANPTISVYCNLRTSGKNKLWVDAKGQTNHKGVYAAGGIVLGFKPVEQVIAHSQKIAQHIVEELTQKK